MSELKLGKKAPVAHPRTLKLSNYLTGAVLPPPPQKTAWEYAIADDKWEMLGNDAVGDCVIAAMLHYIMAATAHTRKAAMFNTRQAIQLYSAITGYNPADPSTDQGTVMTDAFSYWQSIGLFGHKILGWAAIDHTDLNEIKQGINLFGGVLVGTAITESMMAQAQAEEAWNPPYLGAVLGGHAIPWLGYGKLGQTCITWGARLQMSPRAIEEVDEAYVVITEDWLDAQGKSPSGLNMDALEADLRTIAQ